MLKRYTMLFGFSFVLGMCTPVGLALYVGGERLAVAGIKLAAIENGVSLARRDWQFDAVPVHEAPLSVAQVEPQPVKPRKVAKR